MKSLWKFFASIKLTVLVLLSLAVTSIIGTLIPQNQPLGVYLQKFGPFWFQLFDVFNFFDMYHSGWFQFLLLLLTLNVVVCSVERLSATWKTIFIRRPVFRLERFRKLTHREEFDDPRSPAELRGLYEPLVAKGFGYLRREDLADGGFCLFAERWRRSRLGVYLVHLSVVLLLLGGMVGSIFGYEAFVNIPEGDSVDSVRLRGSNALRPLNFEIRCDDFKVDFYPGGAPKEYRSSLSVLEKGQVVLTKDIIVNDPLRYQGIGIFQSSYGKLPAQPALGFDFDPKAIALKIVGLESGMTYHRTTALDRDLDLPEGRGRLRVVAYHERADFSGQDVGQALEAILTPPDGPPVSILLPLRFPNFDRMRRGSLVIAAAGPASGTNPVELPIRYYTGLQVVRDPGVGLVYIGFVVMIVGCCITFFMPHQQLCLAVNSAPGGSRVMLAGLARRSSLAMYSRIRNIARTLIKM